MQSYLKKFKKLRPIKTTTEARTTHQKNIKAVIFDIYGTLLISASGDIGSSELGLKCAINAFRDCDIPLNRKQSERENGLAILDAYQQEILSTHERLKKRGIDYPEVDIIKVWKGVTQKLHKRGTVAAKSHFNESNFRKLAMAFEYYSNPVYPMPHMKAVLEKLQKRNIKLGIISNAQFFTPILINHFLGQEFQPKREEAHGFDKSLSFFSYRCGVSKPSKELFKKEKAVLSKLKIKAQECLFVGNDMLKDIYPSQAVGFQGVLFAGDKRSLRLRKDNPKTKNLKPKHVITRLTQLFDII